MVINKKKILIILISLVIIILIIKVADNMSTPPKIEDYLKDIGFTNEGESALYYKQISEIDKFIGCIHFVANCSLILFFIYF